MRGTMARLKFVCAYLCVVGVLSGVPPHVVRERNFYPKDRPELLVSPSGSPISNLSVHRLWKRLKERANYEEQLAQVREFNRTHKNKKRGISMTTTKYGVQASFMGALVNVYSDASIMITHGGCEIGQGIHTKVAQVASHELGKLLGRPVPMGAIRFSDTNSHIVPNMGMTGGSTTSGMRRCSPQPTALPLTMRGVAPFQSLAAKPCVSRVLSLWSGFNPRWYVTGPYRVRPTR